MISDADVAFYRANGFLVASGIVDDGLLAELRAVTDTIVAGAYGLPDHTDVYDLEPNHRPERPRVRRIKRPDLVHPLYARTARYPPLVSALIRLLGPNVRHQGGILNMKSAGYGAPLEWHQDWPFYPHTNDDLLVAGIFLDDIDDENGPVTFVSGTHRGPVYDHHHEGRFVGAIQPDAIAPLVPKAVKATGPAGSVSFHHCRVVHGSALNRTSRPRRILFYEMQAADAWPIMGIANHYSADPEHAYDVYNSRLVAGEPTNRPRMENIPVQLPLPKPLLRGSIYQAQSTLTKTFFERYEETTP